MSNINPCPQEGQTVSSATQSLWTRQEAATWLKVHPDRLRKDLNSGRINQSAFIRLSPRRTRFYPEQTMSLAMEGRLYADSPEK